MGGDNFQGISSVMHFLSDKTAAADVKAIKNLLAETGVDKRALKSALLFPPSEITWATSATELDALFIYTSMFKNIDVNLNGYHSIDEIRNFCQKVWSKEGDKEIKHRVMQMINLYDTGDQQISFQEFLDGLVCRREFQRGFNILANAEGDKVGHISKSDLAAIMRFLNPQTTPTQSDAMFEAVQVNGVVEQNGFLTMGFVTPEKVGWAPAKNMLNSFKFFTEVFVNIDIDANGKHAVSEIKEYLSESYDPSDQLKKNLENISGS